MKIIDLLNKIANEDIPKKIKYSGVIYEYDYYKGDCGYVDMSQNPYKWFEKEIDCDVPSFLNEEVEIIEEEKIKMCNVLEHCVDFSKNENILLDNQLRLQDKINELIAVLNEM